MASSRTYWPRRRNRNEGNTKKRSAIKDEENAVSIEETILKSNYFLGFEHRFTVVTKKRTAPINDPMPEYPAYRIILSKGREGIGRIYISTGAVRMIPRRSMSPK